MQRRIMVDMSATLLHHGHIRLLKRAHEDGHVIVALTTDEEILQAKGYIPELEYNAREEILSSIRYVGEVVPAPWRIDEDFLAEHRIDYLVHGSDNSNQIPTEKLRIYPRTEGISSSLLRLHAMDNIFSRNKSNTKLSRKLIESIFHVLQKELRRNLHHANMEFQS